MASKGKFQKEFHDGYGLEIEWRITSQNLTNKTSVVEAKFYLVSYASYYTINSSASKSGYLRVNGSSSSFTTSSALLAGNQKRLLDTYSRTISHDSNGNASTDILGSFDIQVTLGSTYYSNVSLSGTAKLNSMNATYIKGWDGSNWKNGAVKVWDGSNWRNATTIYAWDGDNWIS